MLGICVNNKSGSLEPTFLEIGFTASSVLHLVEKKRYEIFGMCLIKSALEYLVLDETGFPNWYPASCFDISGGAIPRSWHFKFFGESELGVKALWGFDELVNQADYFDGLSERNQTILEKFLDLAKSSSHFSSL